MMEIDEGAMMFLLNRMQQPMVKQCSHKKSVKSQADAECFALSAVFDKCNTIGLLGQRYRRIQDCDAMDEYSGD